MITFLRKLFIKNYQNTTDPKVRKSHGVFAAIGGIIINLLLFAFKLTIGLLTFSLSIISDAINNLTDLFSSFVNLFGFHIASKPADKEHPFGHQRVEYIAGMIVSFVVLAIAIMVGYTSISLLIEADKNRLDFSSGIWAFIILGVSILLKIFLGLFYNGLGKAIDSVALKASMQDSLNDVYCTVAVLIATIVQYFYPQFWWLDLAMSLGVAFFITYLGIKMIIETASPLIGSTPDKELVKNIVADIKAHEEVLGVHDLLAHTYGPNKIFVSLHVELDGYQSMFTAHELIDGIEEQIAKKYGVNPIIHIDPIDTKNPLIPILKSQIDDILQKIDPKLSFHDLRLINKENKINILFDLASSDELKCDLKNLNKKVVKQVNDLDKKYHCVIRIDQNYLDCED
ncbi:MAG: cation diffusion facilitator family transporter [Bacilli bacterium]